MEESTKQCESPGDNNELLVRSWHEDRSPRSWHGDRSPRSWHEDRSPRRSWHEGGDLGGEGQLPLLRRQRSLSPAWDVESIVLVRHGSYFMEDELVEDEDEDDDISWQPCPGDRPMYDGADMATSDLPEEHVPPEPQAQPPDVSKLTRIPGYENVGYYANTSGPPIAPPPEENNKGPGPPSNRDSEHYQSIEHISEDHAREALLDHAAGKCCYGKAAAGEMVLEKITPSSALIYTLESFTETRGTSWEQEPYRGQPIDSPANGPAPLPWEIPCQSSNPFTNEIHHLEVPHTATVMHCHGCRGQGWIRCHSCLGRGFKRCVQCHGSGREWKTDAHGHRHVESCWHCHGTGRKRCISCSGDGRVVCRTCHGYRQLKCYIRLSVTFANHTVHQVLERTDMPGKLLRCVSGITVFEQTAESVCPLTYYPDTELCEASQRLITEHLHRYPRSRTLLQRHQLKEIPVTECAFSWKNKKGRFWVYGKENKVYAHNYPQRCCGGCIVL